MRKVFLLLCMISIHIHVVAQDPVRQFIVEMLEEMAQNQDEDILDDDELVERLMNIYDHPIDLNLATREQLEELVFLSDFQIENLLAHIFINGPLEQIFELAAIDGFIQDDIDRLLPFVRIITIPERSSYRIKPQITTLGRVQTVLPRPVGYSKKEDGSPAPYLGGRLKMLGKSDIRIKNIIHAGFLLESDAGEPLFSHGIKAFDFMSAFALYQPQKGVVSKILVGDYSARFGQGLGMWTGYSLMQSAENTSVRRRATGLTRYHSAGESSFLRGAGIELKYRSHRLSLFGSHRPIDASVDDIDTLGNRMISAFRSTGLHRTVGELYGRHSIVETLAGAYYQTGSRLFRIGMGGGKWSISQPLAASDALYRRFYFKGSEMSSFSADYRVFLSGLHLYGELAVQDLSALAIIQGADFKPGGGVTATLAYRYFSNSYTPLFQTPWSKAGSPGGESGVYGAIQFQPFKRLLLTTSINYFHFRWLRYRVSAPSSGFDWSVWSQWSVGWGNKIVLRYRFSSQEQDRIGGGTPTPVLSRQNRQSLRLQWQNKTSDVVSFQTIVAFSGFNEVMGIRSAGYWFSQDVSFAVQRLKMNVTTRVAHFDTDDYYSRIYVYEPDVLYAFSVPARSGNGVVGLLNVGWKPSRAFQLWARVSLLHRRDGTTVGSGYDLIESPTRAEFKLQFRYRF